MADPKKDPKATPAATPKTPAAEAPQQVVLARVGDGSNLVAEVIERTESDELPPFVFYRLPDKEGQQRWRPALVVDSVTRELQVFFSRNDRDASHLWHLSNPSAVKPGTAVGCYRRSPS